MSDPQPTHETYRRHTAEAAEEQFTLARTGGQVRETYTVAGTVIGDEIAFTGTVADAGQYMFYRGFELTIHGFDVEIPQ